jgi:hypothetical protein
VAAHLELGTFETLKMKLFDEEELPATCWACTYTYTSPFAPNKAHIIPFSRGGSNDPVNYWLLYDVCHAEQPDGLSRGAQFAWLKGRPTWIVDFHRDWKDVIEALLAEIRSRSPHDKGESLIRMFLAEVGPSEIQAAYVTGCEKAAGQKNARQNARWSLLELFRTWYDKKTEPTAREKLAAEGVVLPSVEFSFDEAKKIVADINAEVSKVKVEQPPFGMNEREREAMRLVNELRARGISDKTINRELQKRLVCQLNLFGEKL